MNAVEEVQVAERMDELSLKEATRFVEEMMRSESWQKLEVIEDELGRLPQVFLPLHHTFCPGIYLREVLIPKGTLLTSRIHLVEHPYIISSGMVSIWTDESGCETFYAPHSGVTKPGTRRILYAHTDVTFATCHANPDNGTDPDEIVRRVTYTGGKYAELGGAKA